MKKIVIAAMLLSVPGVALAAKPCEELKAEIAAKLEAKHVTGFTLDVQASDAAGDAKVVGSCESGSKKIVYSKG
jgi:hypothetical protein